MSAGFAIILAAGSMLLFFPERTCDFVVALERKRAGLKQYSISVDYIDYQYLKGGKGPPLVLIHGFGADKDNWTIAARYLTPHFTVIVPDLPGFGESTKSISLDYTVTTQASRLNDFVNALGLETFHIGGSSMGGTVAAAYTFQFNDKIESMWLIAPGGVRSAKESYYQKEMKKGNNLMIITDTGSYNVMIKSTFAKSPFLLSFVKRVFVDKAVQNMHLNKKICNDIFSETIPLEQVLKGMKTPTLIMWGDKDRVLDISGANILCKNLINARMAVIKNTGHVPMIEKPEEAANEYLKFSRHGN